MHTTVIVNHKSSCAKSRFLSSESIYREKGIVPEEVNDNYSTKTTRDKAMISNVTIEKTKKTEKKNYHFIATVNNQSTFYGNPVHLEMLLFAISNKQIEVWNEWFATRNIKEMIDLSGTNLSHLDLSQIDLKNANLTHAKLCNTNFEKAKLEYAHLKYANCRGASFKGAHLHHTDLSYANLKNTTFTTSEFIKAYLKKAFIKNVHLIS